ncbi:MAG TPA: DNA polymerase III subunit beta [Candidatus Megaira endosymbiont of Nemacystus decipiens]|nr:DNA polymerase III subunit beta [Candidatus Megaera endosymbiont of Nemacystus decipiens]
MSDKKDETKLLNISVNTKELAHALSFANSVVEKRNILSELGNIKLLAKNNSLEIGATDMDLYLNQEIGAQVTNQGETTVSTQLLSDIIRKIPDEYLQLSQSENEKELLINGRNCNFKLLTLPTANFPIMEGLDSSSHLKLPCKDLLHLIDSTNFSISNDETRYNLSGLYFHINDNDLYSASTDGHRLSVSSKGIKEVLDNSVGIIIPKKTVLELAKIIRDSKNIQSEISMSFSNTKIRFECNNIILVSKIIDGSFPDYRQLIPSENNNRLVIATNLLKEAIDRIATITVEKFRAIKFFIQSDNLKLTATGEAKGMASEVLYYKEDKNISYIGAEMSIGFNPRYWTDVLSSIDSEYIEVSLKDYNSPVLIKAVSNPTDLFVIMPVKV